MKALITILVAILQVILPALFKAATPTAEDSAPQPELKRRLRGRVRQTWAVVFLCAVLLNGCANRTVLVPEGEPVRLRETIRNAKVWVADGNGKPTAGKMDLPAGWFCVALPPEDEGY